MNHRLRTLALLGFLALPTTSRAVVGAGDVAPNFTKTDHAGVVRSLSDYAGKVVLLFELGYY